MSEKNKKSYEKSVYRSFVMIIQFGINMLVPICMMSALGIFLDKKLGTSFIMVIFFFIGAIAGGQNIYRMAKKIFDMEDNGQYGKDITAAERKEREN
jgi:F0F1-type ATP synthase assembly protein I